MVCKSVLICIRLITCIDWCVCSKLTQLNSMYDVCNAWGAGVLTTRPFWLKVVGPLSFAHHTRGPVVVQCTQRHALALSGGTHSREERPAPWQNSFSRQLQRAGRAARSGAADGRASEFSTSPAVVPCGAAVTWRAACRQPRGPLQVA